MIGHTLRQLELAAILQVGRDPRSPKRMTADFGVDAGGQRAAA